MNRTSSLLIPMLALSAAGFGQYTITTSALPIATVGQGYSTVIQTNSTFAATACNVVSGALPAGLAFQVNGTGCAIFGTPTVATTANFSMAVSNNQGQTTPARSLVLAVFGITSTSIPTATFQAPFSFQLLANGGATYQWSVLAGSLPPGLSLGTSGLLSGTPLATGVYSFTLRVVDPGLGLIDARGFFLTVAGEQGGQFQIIPSSLPNATVNQNYSSAIQTTGATGGGPTVCLVVQGSLAPGLSVAPSGASCLVSGVPTNLGTYQFQLQASDSLGRTTPAVTFTVTVAGAGGGSGGLTITTSSIPNGTTALPFAPNGVFFVFAATGGTGIYSWFVESGALPNGLTLATNGTLAGTPTLAGSFNFTIRVVSGGLLTSFQQTGTKSFSMTITSGGLTIVETSLPSATVGFSYSFQLHGSGGTPPYQWSLGSTGAQGLTIASNSGLISGTPQAAGTYSFPVTVSDGASGQVTVAYSLVITSPFSILTPSLPDGFPGNFYSQSLQATGGQAPYIWSVASGTLPPGLTLSPSGTLSGAPTVNGQFSITVMARDAGARTTTRVYTIQIGAAGPVQILTNVLPGGAVGTAYLQALSATGGQTPYTWSLAAGSLPPGLNLTAAGGIQGTPTQGGSFSFAIQAADAIGNSTAKGLTLVITSTGLTVSPSQLSFAFVAAGAPPAAQQVSVTGTGNQSFTAAANTAWLSVSPSSGTTPTTLNVSVSPTGLAVGVYTGSVTATPAGGSDPVRTISVTLTVSVSSGLVVSPSAMAFAYQTGGTLPAPQNLFVGSGGSAVGFGVSTSGGTWLSVAPSSGTTPAELTVSVNPIGLASAVYSGTITVFGGGISHQVLVTLTVSPPVTPVVSLSRTSLSFTYQFGGASPPTQTVTMSSTPSVSFTAVSGAPWLSVTPDVGTTPATLFITVSPTGLSPATYNSAINITTSSSAGNSALSLPITFTLTSEGFPVVTTVVNAASYAAAAVAPGEIVSIGGVSLGPNTAAFLTLDESGKVATTLGGTQVLFNGFPAPLTYVSATQINAVVPYEIAGQLTLQVAVRNQGRTSVAFPGTIVGSAPGLFTLNASGTGPGAIVHQDGSINSPLNPARKGAFVTLYATGEGQTSPRGETGKVTTIAAAPPITPRPILPVTVSIGGQAATVSFYGEAPGFVAGVMQLNVQIPVDAASGELAVEISVGGNRSQSGVTVSVQ